MITVLAVCALPVVEWWDDATTTARAAVVVAAVTVSGLLTVAVSL